MSDIFIIDVSGVPSCRTAIVLDGACHVVKPWEDFPCVSGVWTTPDYSGRWNYCCDSVVVTINESA